MPFALRIPKALLCGPWADPSPDFTTGTFQVILRKPAQYLSVAACKRYSCHRFFQYHDYTCFLFVASHSTLSTTIAIIQQPRRKDFPWYWKTAVTTAATCATRRCSVFSCCCRESGALILWFPIRVFPAWPMLNAQAYCCALLGTSGRGVYPLARAYLVCGWGRRLRMIGPVVSGQRKIFCVPYQQFMAWDSSREKSWIEVELGDFWRSFDRCSGPVAYVSTSTVIGSETSAFPTAPVHRTW